MLLILGISALVGIIMFVVDVLKWSKRPEKITTMEEDLSKQVVKNVDDLEGSK